MRRSTHLRIVPLLFSCLVLFGISLGAETKKSLSFTDLMKMRSIEEPVIADNGAWVAYALVPDRGDGELVVRATSGGSEYRADRGRAPQITPDGAWVAARLEPTLAAKETQKAHGGGKGKGKDKGPKPGLLLVATADGTSQRFARVERFAFSADGRFLVRQMARPDAADTDSDAEDEKKTSEQERGAEPQAGASKEVAPQETATEAADDDHDPEPGTLLVLRELASGDELEIADVDGWALDDVGRYLAYGLRTADGEANGVRVRALSKLDAMTWTVTASPGARYHALAWTHEPISDLAFVAEPASDHHPRVEAPDPEPDTTPEKATGTTPGAENGPSHAQRGDTQEGTQPPATALWIWRGDKRHGAAITASSEAPTGWYLPAENELRWSRDARRLFFGYRPESDWIPPDENPNEDPVASDSDPEASFDPYDTAAILEDRTLDVWHGKDPLIQPNQRQRWEEEKKRLYRALYHRPRGGGPAGGRVVPLADREVRTVAAVDNPRGALATADVPYLRQRTWEGFSFDLYWISLVDGARQRIAEHLSGNPSLSPGGRYVVYYRTPHWYLWDSADGSTRNLTAALGVPFANEDHDYPQSAPGYAVADWLEDDSAVLIEDKYDVWRLPTGHGDPQRITGGSGRREHIIFRVVDLEPDRDFVRADETLLLTGYHDRLKHRGFFAATPTGRDVRPLLVPGAETLSAVVKAKHRDRILFTRERYDMFPDLWIAGRDFDAPQRLSDANPEIADFAWGHAEKVQWRDLDGRLLDGVLIKPGGYEPGKRYPVLVYFYRFFSQRLYRFNDLAVNHRPSFPVYASHGYAIFLPDIRFEVGRPGLSATKALVPGVQKLIEMGIADPDAIGLHGHSWSGYQTAFVITQTRIFKAAVAGAPVSNMTSAYGGIRWGSGLARQFQYEQSQSRIGASLWQARDRYIDNSPLFFADRIQTPLLIMFGDQDDAVPWYQGIELYLALRRLDKEVVFLQYRGEPHHLKKYPNKLDYAIKMKSFFDHYLKGAPAPAWLAEGVPFRGD